MEYYPDNKDLFFLSAKERKTLEPFVKASLQVREIFQNTEVTDANVEEITKEQIVEFERLCKSFQANIDDVSDIAKRVFTVQWFCVFQTGATFGDWTGKQKDKPFLLYSMLDSSSAIALVSDSVDADALSISKHADFYREIQNGFDSDIWESVDRDTALNIYYSNIREALNLPSSFRYIDYDSLHTLYDILSTSHKPRSPKERLHLAKTQGALTTLQNRLSTPSSVDFEKAFTPERIKELPVDFTAYSFDERTGQYSFFDKVTFNELLSLHSPFLSAMATFVKDSPEDANSIIFYAPSLFEEGKLELRQPAQYRAKESKTELQELRRDYILSVVSQFERFCGVIDGAWYRVLAFGGYDPSSEVFSLFSPYLFKLRERTKELEDMHSHSEWNEHIFPSAISENRIAFEVANYIIARLDRLGDGKKKTKRQPKKVKRTIKKKNGDEHIIEEEFEIENPAAEPVTLEPKYSTIINECPSFKAALDEIDARKDSKNKAALYNTKLRQVLESAYRIILEKSDIPSVYKDFCINGVSEWSLPEDECAAYAAKKTKRGKRRVVADFQIPTRSKIDQKLKVTHNGKRRQRA